MALVNLAPSDGLDGRLAWRIIPLFLRQMRARRGVRSKLRVVAKRK